MLLYIVGNLMGQVAPLSPGMPPLMSASSSPMPPPWTTTGRLPPTTPTTTLLLPPLHVIIYCRQFNGGRCSASGTAVTRDAAAYVGVYFSNASSVDHG
jgi:hypothetical protein